MILSILDNDLYSFTQQAAILSLYPAVRAKFGFINRCPQQRFNKSAVEWLKWAVNEMASLRLSEDEVVFLKRTCPYLPVWYFSWLKDYRFDPAEVQISLDEGTGALSIEIEGLWQNTILWEVPLLALVSEAYFKDVDTNWSYKGQLELIQAKGQKLYEADAIVSDFSTRRRRAFGVQKMVVQELSKFPNFVGTSNPLLAMMHPILVDGREHKPKGTMSHQWIMAHQYFTGIRHCNSAALEAWQKVYGSNLGTALTDTVGSDAFFADIDPLMARRFDGLRHDSGPYKDFVEKSLAFFRRCDIDPMSKSIIFSDGLTTDLAIEICEYCCGKIKCAFGIGTHFANDFGLSKALNIVIKLRWINHVPVVKISDSLTKAIGDRDYLRMAFLVHYGVPLDDPRWATVA